MLSSQDNELMCRVGPGTAQGAALRRFWLPALMSAELPEKGGDPLAIELLGERLVAFRGEDGLVGVVDETCRHRGASLALGRVENCGVRCIYHGWKFGADGTVQETPNVSDENFKTRFKIKAYPTHEAGGMVWVYMGEAAQQPPPPQYPFMAVPDDNCLVAMAVVNCNFVQVLEGLVDSSHLTILHSVGLKATTSSTSNFALKTNHMQFDAAPRLEAEDTNFGFHYVAMRDKPGNRTMARIAAFQAPCFLYNPNGDLWFAVVPMNDEKTMFFHVWWDPIKQMGLPPHANEQLEMVGLDQDSLDEWGMTRAGSDTDKAPSRLNGYKQDRAAVRAGHFTGILNFTQEDAVVSVSSGPIRDRREEMLAPADIAVSRLYRTLLSTARSAARGEDPIGLHADTMSIVGVSGEIETSGDWRLLAPTNRALIAAE